MSFRRIFRAFSGSIHGRERSCDSNARTFFLVGRVRAKATETKTAAPMGRPSIYLSAYWLPRFPLQSV
ncbi:MAG: hypothetical protein OT477_13015 [Chloroflexi bacterium]|nr:hypothetical protein [Chloroflexota bacterium]